MLRWLWYKHSFSALNIPIMSEVSLKRGGGGEENNCWITVRTCGWDKACTEIAVSFVSLTWVNMKVKEEHNGLEIFLLCKIYAAFLILVLCRYVGHQLACEHRFGKPGIEKGRKAQKRQQGALPTIFTTPGARGSWLTNNQQWREILWWWFYFLPEQASGFMDVLVYFYRTICMPKTGSDQHCVLQLDFNLCVS